MPPVSEIMITIFQSVLPVLTSRLVLSYRLDDSISSFMGVWWMFSVLLFCIQLTESRKCRPWIQTPCFVASELGLHYLHISPKQISSLRTGYP